MQQQNFVERLIFSCAKIDFEIILILNEISAVFVRVCVN
jgi:hypothetical protein